MLPVPSGKDRWAVILAGGDGTRLQSLTRVISGDDRPKQFCAFQGSTTLLDQTRQRIALSVPNKYTLTVVTQTHERFYKPLLKKSAKNRLLVQPINKGTAPAILLSALKISQLSPNAQSERRLSLEWLVDLLDWSNDRGSPRDPGVQHTRQAN